MFRGKWRENPDHRGKDEVVINWVAPNYTTTKEDYLSIYNSYEAAVKKMLETVPANATTAQKVAAVNDYIASISTYSSSIASKNCSLGTFLNGGGQCKAYTMAFIDGMNRLGIENKYIAGNNNKHAWVMVNIDNEWYHVDPTWNDTTNQGHKYLLLSDAEIERLGHYNWSAMASIGVGVPAPKATSTKYENYNWGTANANLIEDVANVPETQDDETKTVPAPVPVPDGLIATPTTSKVIVDGNVISFDAYNINGSNYFKLRDLAMVVADTSKQFSVGYDDAKNAITLYSGFPYIASGGELAKGDGKNKNAIETSSKIFKDETEIAFTAFNIGGNNYFKLRDIGKVFDFAVLWSDVEQTIVIDTTNSYSTE